MRRKHRLFWLENSAGNELSVGFDTRRSNWPYVYRFPFFIANAVEWLNPAMRRVSQLLVKQATRFARSDRPETGRR